MLSSFRCIRRPANLGPNHLFAKVVSRETLVITCQRGKRLRKDTLQYSAGQTLIFCLYKKYMKHSEHILHHIRKCIMGKLPFFPVKLVAPAKELKHPAPSKLFTFEHKLNRSSFVSKMANTMRQNRGTHFQSKLTQVSLEQMSHYPGNFSTVGAAPAREYSLRASQDSPGRVELG